MRDRIEDVDMTAVKMEDVCIIKVKRKVVPRGAYPSERRYSASTVAGLAWVYLVLAATCLALAGLAAARASAPAEDGSEHRRDGAWTGAGGASAAGAGCAAAGGAALRAARCWYIDSSIAWFCLASALSGAVALAGAALALVTLATPVPEDPTRTADRLLCGNILLACVAALLWSLLSLAISYKGMRNQSVTADSENRRAPPRAPAPTSRLSTLSWGDTLPVYNQNNLDLSRVVRDTLSGDTRAAAGGTALGS